MLQSSAFLQGHLQICLKNKDENVYRYEVRGEIKNKLFVKKSTNNVLLECEDVCVCVYCIVNIVSECIAIE